MEFIERIPDGHGGTKIRVNFHAGQQAAMDSTARIVVVCAGSQVGKSSLTAWWLEREIRRCTHLNRRDGGYDFYAVTKSHEQLGLRFLPILRECFEDILHIGRWWAQSRVIELADPTKSALDPSRFWAKGPSDKMWGRIIIRSAESPSSLESGTGVAAIADETGDWPLASWEALQRRLSLAVGKGAGRTLIASTPYSWNFFKWLICDRAYRTVNLTKTERTETINPKGEKDIEVFQFSSTLNPNFPASVDEENRRSMPAWKYAMMREGRFVRPLGVVYDCFDPTVHVTKDCDRHGRFWVAGVDFGLQTTACHAGLWNPATDHLHVEHEYDSGHRSAEEHVLGILNLNGRCPYLYVYGGSAGEAQFRMEFTMRGLRVLEPRYSSVDSRIHSTYGSIRNGKVSIHPRCARLIDDLQSMSYELAEDGQTLLPRIRNKGAYHFADSFSYLRSSLVPRTSRIMDLDRHAKKQIPQDDPDDPVGSEIPWELVL